MLGMKGMVLCFLVFCLFFFPHKQHLPFPIAAAFSIQTAQPHANAPRDSKGMEQSAQASEEGVCWGGQQAQAVERSVSLQTGWTAATSR